jgi:hypothetical protein
MVKILSFDVGIRNLSFCYLETSPSNTHILDWKTVCITEQNCKKAKIEDLTLYMLETLMSNFDSDFQADVVLIENQPMLLNGLMKTLSVVIYTYFNVLKLQYGNVCEVRFISATNKLKCKLLNEGDKTCKKTYKDRKKLSIEIARKYIENVFTDKKDWFETNTKKDDYSDTLCQAIYYIESILKHEIKRMF